MFSYTLLICIAVVINSSLIYSKSNVGQTPQMGWNSWNHFACDVSEDLIKETASSLVKSGLNKLGYNYINLDDCWQANERDSYGKIQPDSKRFPSGLKSLGDYIHNLGLKFGVYSSAGFKTCQAFPASLGVEDLDAQSYAEWGVDYLKYDNCYQDHGAPEERFSEMSKALNNSGREIFYSLCEWGRENPAIWASKISNSWRISNDIRDDWDSIIGRVDIGASLWRFSGPGGWNDPDMLEVGNGGCSYEEYKSHFSLWSIIKAPLILGMDLSVISESSLEIVSNKDVIDINQDSLGRQGRRIWSDNSNNNFDLIATKCSTGKANVYEDSIIDQQWILQSDGTIKSLSNGLCLIETSSIRSTNESESGLNNILYGISTSECSSATTWLTEGYLGGSIISKKSGLCLEVSKFELSAVIQGKRLQTAKCRIISDDPIDGGSYKGFIDVREHQSWIMRPIQLENFQSSFTLVNLYQRQCLTVNKDAPNGDKEIWNVDLSDNSMAILLLNKGHIEQTITFSKDMITKDLISRYKVYDLWTKKEIIHDFSESKEFSRIVKSHGVSYLKLTPL